MLENQWQLQQAKACLSDLIKRAQKLGPQHITVHGKRAVVVISEKEYNKIIKNKLSFVEFIRQSPLMGLDISFKRDSSKFRDIDL